MFIASSSPKGSKGVDHSAKWNLCQLAERGLDRARITIRTRSSKRGPSSRMSLWMRRRSCVANNMLERLHLLRSARNVHLHQTLPPRTRSLMPQKRRHRLYALTFLTSLILASWTSKKSFQPPCRICRASLEDILPIAYSSVVFAGVSATSGLRFGHR